MASIKSLNECLKKHGYERGCYRYIKNYNNRYLRLKKRVKYILDNFEYVYFATYTISETYINNDIDFIRSLKKTLKNCCYVLNEDFGGKNGRLHFHCLIGLYEYVSFTDLSWKYGACNFKTIYKANAIKISKYIIKLSNHTRGFKVIYSRLNCKRSSTGKIVY